MNPELPKQSLDFDALEVALQRNFPAVDAPLKHIFTPGLYTRQVLLRKGCIYTSKVHKTEHPFIVSMGHVSVYNEHGICLQEIKAPWTGITQAGARRMVLVHEDCIWTTFHANPTDTQDLDEIESKLIEKPLIPLNDED